MAAKLRWQPFNLPRSMDEDCSKTSMKSDTDQKLDMEKTEIEKKEGLALLIYDLKQRKLIPIKILSLVVFSGYGVLLPYAAIHMKSLGISVEETGAIYSVNAVLSVLIPICSGMIADKLGNFKMLLSVLFGCTSITSLIFLLVPVGRISVAYPTNMSMALGCFNNDNSTLTLTDLDLHPCKFKLYEDSENSVINVSATLGECGSVCYRSDKSDTEATLETASSFVSDTNLDHSIGKEFLDAVFFPNDWDLEMSCLQNLSARSICQLDRKSGAVSRKEKTATLALKLFQSDYNIERMIPVLWMALEDESEFDHKSSDFQCSTYGEKLNLLQTVYSQDNQTENNPITHYRMCRSQCVVQINRSDLCSDKVREEVINPQLTFWIYLLLRSVFEVFIVGSATLFDGAALVLVNEVRGDFGFQKMFGLIGISIFSPISGALMDYFNTNENDKNFRPAFFLFAGLFGTAAVGMLTIDLNFKPPAEKLMKNVISLLKNVELDVLLAVCIISGMLTGCTGSYFFLFLEEIGGSRSLMGLTLTVSCLTGIPLLLLSDTIFRKFSIPNVLVFSLFTFVVRLSKTQGYSYIYNPNLCLVYEAMEAITGILPMTSFMIYATQLGTTSTATSIQGLISATYIGLGAGIGSSVGGVLIGAFGQRVVFRILGVIAFLTGFFYFLFNILYLRLKANDKNNTAEKADSSVNRKVEEIQ
ncbi:hypothetical protein DAPPUDRAFT_311258 [Daphnia pulex]|uniref:Major facilitator superfamily associated domain-containing protein n=1 Tax=Daphnia pulex TaxID=6669 RepID=E9FWC8_DAPPU|nr:hypothetical protein DAPPUDRAFT_311258 [Daphnia pulex]|eukprot:EFX88451.1 hypothetical protein DAPPUDRAFT_311258 [Daphnia pulex]